MDASLLQTPMLPWPCSPHYKSRQCMQQVVPLPLAEGLGNDPPFTHRVRQATSRARAPPLIMVELRQLPWQTYACDLPQDASAYVCRIMTFIHTLCLERPVSTGHVCPHDCQTGCRTESASAATMKPFCTSHHCPQPNIPLCCWCLHTLACNNVHCGLQVW